jgi:Pentapeptide repeats (8 copies)
LAILNQLDGERKRTVLLFLREARLINGDHHVRDGRMIYPRVVGLRIADLTNARLHDIQLVSTDREETVFLEGTVLKGAELRHAILEGADLRDANLRGADLGGSEETKEAADLRGAGLTRATLTDVDLRGARYDAETTWPEDFSPRLPGLVPVR